MSSRHGRVRFVAGSMGPTTKAITVTGGVTFRGTDRRTTTMQAKALVEGGADILLLETCQDTRNVKAGAARHPAGSRTRLGYAIPVMVSGTIEPMGTMLAGQTADAFYASVSHADLLSIGLNCATGPEFMTDHIRTCTRCRTTRISCYPNAGLPERRRQIPGDADSRSPRSSSALSTTAGSTSSAAAAAPPPAHIKAIAQMVEGKKPRRVKTPSHRAYYSGHRTGRSGGKQPAADRRRAHQRDRLAPVQEHGRGGEVGRGHRNRALAGQERRAHRRCLPADPRDRDEMNDIPPFYEKLIRKIKAPIMIDTTDPKAVELSLTYCQGKSIINSDQSRRRRREIRAHLSACEGLWRGAGRRLHR